MPSHPTASQLGGDGDWDLNQGSQPIVGTLVGSGNTSGTMNFTITSGASSYSFAQGFNQNLSQNTAFSATIPPDGQAFLNSLPLGSTFSISVTAGSSTSTETNFSVTCFAAGTRVMTARGEVLIEDLRVGDLVVVAQSGAALQPVIWLGHTRVNVAAHADRAAVAPIRITAGALADGVPQRDLRVSPEHAMFLDGHLVPARMLVNGTTIVQETWCPEVTYWHVELPAHGLLVAEGAISESYFDDGNRKNFDNFGITTLFKDFESERGNGSYAANACRPLMQEGAGLDRLRGRIAARADAMATQARNIA